MKLPPPQLLRKSKSAGVMSQFRKSISARLTFKSFALSMALFVSGASMACDFNGWDPVAPDFCEEFVAPVFPYGVPTIELKADAGYARMYLPDGTRILLDLADGTVTAIYANGQMETAPVTQLPSDVQAQFWALAARAANNPAESFLMPVDNLMTMANQFVAAGEPKARTSSGGFTSTVGGDDSNCEDGASGEPILDCVEVTAYLYYWNVSFGGGWSRVSSPSEIPRGAYRCPFTTIEQCRIVEENQRREWEEKQAKACTDRFWSAGLTIGSYAASHIGCRAVIAGAIGTGTGAGAAPGIPVMSLGGIACIGGAIGTLHNASNMLEENEVCVSEFPGPRG